MTNAPSREAIEHAFVLIERAAVRGERCPMNGDGQVHTKTCMALALEGRIRFHIHGYNFRVAVMLSGIHVGKWTAPDPKSGRLWKVIDHNGIRVIRRGEMPLESRIQFNGIPDETNASPRGLSG